MDETDLTPTEEMPEPDTAEKAPKKTRRDFTTALLAVIAVLLVGVLGLQIVDFRQSADITNEVAALTQDVTDLKPLRRDVDILGDQVQALGGQVAAAAAASGASPAAIASQGTDGSLPRFEDSANDAAVLAEMTLATVSGQEYYSGETVSLAASDGKARVWLVWAHWCPYCQVELPELQAWYPENASRFPNVDLVTISSAIDNTRDNPLVPYLDAEEFPFPVIVDESGATSQLFGTTAFPFWVVTDAEGTVMLRVAGALGIESVEQIFGQLETMANET